MAFIYLNSKKIYNLVMYQFHFFLVIKKTMMHVFTYKIFNASLVVNISIIFSETSEIINNLESIFSILYRLYVELD
jgi:hypothetical protein